MLPCLGKVYKTECTFFKDNNLIKTLPQEIINHKLYKVQWETYKYQEGFELEQYASIQPHN